MKLARNEPGDKKNVFSIFTIRISAEAPSTSLPESKPNARAPLAVAISISSSRGIADGSSRQAFCTMAEVFIASSISRLLDDAHPSVPMQTLAPASLSSLYRNLYPEASLRFELMLCTQFTFLLPRISMSSSESQSVCAAMASGPSTPSLSRY